MSKMDLQTIVSNAIAVARAESMKTSPQLTLGEFILKLEIVGNKDLPVVFDVGKYHPTYVDSWRGSYCELAINYETKGKPPSVLRLINILKDAIGVTFVGYKGGDFLMGKTTPIWVANYGESMGFREDKDTAIVDVREEPTVVVIITEALDYC